MSNLLIIYEIASRAKRVTSKQTYLEYERWIKDILQTYQDAAIEKVANIHLFQLKAEYSF